MLNILWFSAEEIQKAGEYFISSCTKQIYLLYKRINCFVQKITFFCTRI